MLLVFEDVTVALVVLVVEIELVADEDAEDVSLEDAVEEAVSLGSPEVEGAGELVVDFEIEDVLVSVIEVVEVLELVEDFVEVTELVELIDGLVEGDILNDAVAVFDTLIVFVVDDEDEEVLVAIAENVGLFVWCDSFEELDEAVIVLVAD